MQETKEGDLLASMPWPRKQKTMAVCGSVKIYTKEIVQKITRRYPKIFEIQEIFEKQVVEWDIRGRRGHMGQTTHESFEDNAVKENGQVDMIRTDQIGDIQEHLG